MPELRNISLLIHFSSWKPPVHTGHYSAALGVHMYVWYDENTFLNMFNADTKQITQSK